MEEERTKITDVKVAYFSAEYGINADLPIYSGGLGILAGDHVKAANDLGIPLVGVGLFYRQGYFCQRIQHNCTQEVLYPRLDPEGMGLELVKDALGAPVVVSVPIENRLVSIQVWCVRVGQVPVYLMDTDIEANVESDRHLTDQLYGGDRVMRLCQEMILGIGGVRVLQALSIVPEVWHLNEGHVALLLLERTREFIKRGVSFETACEAVKANTLFTTHTPVAAGHDVFELEIVNRCFARFYEEFEEFREGNSAPASGPSSLRTKIIELGSIDYVFNMTRLAFQMSSKVNGVSQLHAAVSRELFHRWIPHIPLQNIPVEAVTNGIHTPSWLAPEMKALFDDYFISDWLNRVDEEKVWESVDAIPDERLWEKHQKAKGRMLAYLELPISPNSLVIGFARRFATYKRADLLFQDIGRLEQILFHPHRPVSLVFAGKAHPADTGGQAILRRIIELSQSDRFRARIFFVENYDLRVAQALVQGVDVWLNTPLKPMEASGTSGQKAAVNGVINCSVLDGWWPEGYNGQNGWAVLGAQGETQKEIDRKDGEELYQLFEEKIAPLYYERQGLDFPRGWTSLMKASLRSLAPVFNTRRMVSEYARRFYLPLATRGKRFNANSLELAGRVAAYKNFIRAQWNEVRILSVQFTELNVQVLIQVGSIRPNNLRVEVVGSNGQGGIWRQELAQIQKGESGAYSYELVMPPFASDTWKLTNANLRVFPVSPDFAHDFEMELTILNG